MESSKSPSRPKGLIRVNLTTIFEQVDLSASDKSDAQESNSPAEEPVVDLTEEVEEEVEEEMEEEAMGDPEVGEDSFIHWFDPVDTSTPIPYSPSFDPSFS